MARPSPRLEPWWRPLLGKAARRQSRPPGIGGHRLATTQVDRIHELRRQRLTGPAIAKALGLARSTVGLVLRRLGLNRLNLLEPRPPVIRYERERPGEMIHLDIKSLGRFARIGHRISGDRTGQSKSRGIGWYHLHVAINDASRLAYTEVLPSLGRDDATAFMQRAVSWFARLGVQVERVMTDNGSAYRSRLFASALQQAGTSAPGPTRPAPMARPSASSRPRSGNGPMPDPTQPQTIETWLSDTGPMPTTSPDPMPASQASHPSKD